MGSLCVCMCVCVCVGKVAVFSYVWAQLLACELSCSVCVRRWLCVCVRVFRFRPTEGEEGSYNSWVRLAGRASPLPWPLTPGRRLAGWGRWWRGGRGRRRRRRLRTQRHTPHTRHTNGTSWLDLHYGQLFPLNIIGADCCVWGIILCSSLGLYSSVSIKTTNVCVLCLFRLRLWERFLVFEE